MKPRSKFLADARGVIPMAQVVEDGKVIPFCGEMVLRMHKGQHTVFDFEGVGPQDVGPIVEALAALYEIFDHEDLEQLLGQPQNLSSETFVPLYAGIQQAKTITALAREAGGATTVIAPILKRARQEQNGKFLQWLSGYLQHPIRFYQVDFWKLDQQKLVTGRYEHGRRIVESEHPIQPR